MINLNLTRKAVIVVMGCLMYAICTGFIGNAGLLMAKDNDQQVVNPQEKTISTEDINAVINSLKDTILNIDTRLSNIETKLQQLDDNSNKQEKTALPSKWLSFSKSVKENSVTTIEDNQATVIKSQQLNETATSEKNNDTTKPVVLSLENNVKKVELLQNKSDKIISSIDEVKYNQPNIQEKPAQKEAVTNQIERYKYNISAQRSIENGKEIGAILIGNSRVIVYRDAGASSSYTRAKIVAKRIESYIANGGDIKKLQPIIRNGQYIGSANGNVLFTVDKDTAKKSGLNQSGLTLSWVNNIRQAFGATKINRTAALLASRSLSGYNRPIPASFNNIERSYDRTEMKQAGISSDSPIIRLLLPIAPPINKNVLLGSASWYGPGFNGRRAADGSRFDMLSMTAAHKSLPFGTVVKVTNLRNNKNCLVRITDRGPYIHGRIIDLSKAAAQQVGMLGSGTAQVKVEVVGRLNNRSRR